MRITTVRTIGGSTSVDSPEVLSAADARNPVACIAARQVHRRAGRSLLFIHHAGKGGLQRGTSRREDVLDTVITLRRPADYTPDQGARFEVVLEKGRNVYGDNARSVEARYEERNGAAIWARTEIADAELKRVVDALRDGMSIRETAETLGMHKSKVERLKKKAVNQGMING